VLFVHVDLVVKSDKFRSMCS